jgi:hypothetical protein
MRTRSNPIATKAPETQLLASHVHATNWESTPSVGDASEKIETVNSTPRGKAPALHQRAIPLPHGVAKEHLRHERSVVSGLNSVEEDEKYLRMSSNETWFPI